MVAAADQTVSILGKFQDGISPGLQTTAAAAQGVETNVAAADKSLVGFASRAQTLGVTLKSLASAQEVVITNSQRLSKATEQADKALNFRTTKFKATLEELFGEGKGEEKSLDSLFGPAKTATAVKGLNTVADAAQTTDHVSHNLTNRMERLIGRIFVLQFALQNLGTEGFGKFKPHVESTESFLQIFGSTIALIPNQVGAVIGVVLGLAAAYKKVADAIHEIEKASKELTDKSNLTKIKVAQAQAEKQARIDIAGGGAEAQAQERTREAEENLLSTAKQRAGEEEKLKKLKDDEIARNFALNKLEKDNLQIRDTLSKLEGAGAVFGSGEVIAVQRQALKDNIAAQDALINGNKKGREEQTRLGKAVEDLSEDYIRFLLVLDEAKQKLADIEATRAFRVELNRLNNEIRELAETQSKSNSLDPIDTAKKIADLEAKKTELLRLNRRSLTTDPNDRQNQDRLVFEQLQKQEELQRTIRIEEEERAYAENQIVKALAEQDPVLAALYERMRVIKEQAQQTQEFAKGMKLGFLEVAVPLADLTKLGEKLGGTLATGVSDFTGELIDGLAKGNLKLNEFVINFLLGISKMIAQALVMKGILAGLSLLGFNTGGSVPGLNRGGVIRAAGGIHVPGPRINADIVPAMLTPGEFVIRRSAVDMYGLSAMHAINAGLVPPSVLAGSRAAGPSPLSAGFASGGSVGRQQTPQLVPVIVAGDQDMERMASSGLNGLLRVLTRNREAFNAALGR